MILWQSLQSWPYVSWYLSTGRSIDLDDIMSAITNMTIYIMIFVTWWKYRPWWYYVSHCNHDPMYHDICQLVKALTLTISCQPLSSMTIFIRIYIDGWWWYHVSHYKQDPVYHDIFQLVKGIDLDDIMSVITSMTLFITIHVNCRKHKPWWYHVSHSSMILYIMIFVNWSKYRPWWYNVSHYKHDPIYHNIWQLA